MVAISIRQNFPDVQRWVDTVGKQARFAAMRAINETAKDVQAGIKAEILRVFDRPTPYITSSFRITTWATRDRLEAVIEPKYIGGKGIDPDKVLAAEITGGARRLKRSEVALQRAGILPRGMVTVPGAGAPLDQYGNVKGSFIVQLLSYFQAFSEQGYRANMTDKRKAQLAKRRISASGFRQIAGVEYFVSFGRRGGGKLYGAGGTSISLGRAQHLHPGIWSRTGTHGAVVKPILMFVRQATYRPRLNIDRVGERIVRAKFQATFEREFDNALRTAR